MGAKVGAAGLRYITAFSNGKRGFIVRVPRPQQPGRFARKEFSSNSLPLSLLLRKARQWRDSTYVDLYGYKIPNRTIHLRQSNNLATKIPGVRRQTKSTRKRVREREYVYEITTYIAEIWLEPGLDGKRPRKSRSKVFSVNKYGEDTARDLATCWRKEMERRLLQGGPEKFEKWWATVTWADMTRPQAIDYL